MPELREHVRLLHKLFRIRVGGVRSHQLHSHLSVRGSQRQRGGERVRPMPRHQHPPPPGTGMRENGQVHLANAQRFPCRVEPGGLVVCQIDLPVLPMPDDHLDMQVLPLQLQAIKGWY